MKTGLYNCCRQLPWGIQWKKNILQLPRDCRLNLHSFNGYDEEIERRARSIRTKKAKIIRHTTPEEVKNLFKKAKKKESRDVRSNPQSCLEAIHEKETSSTHQRHPDIAQTNANMRMENQLLCHRTTDLPLSAMTKIAERVILLKIT